MTPELPQLNSFHPSPAPPEPPQPPRWDLSDLALFIGFGALAFVVAYAAVMIGYVALGPLAGWHVPPRGSAETAYLSLALEGVFYLLLLAVVYALVTVRKRLPMWRGLKWKKPGLMQALGYFAAGMFLSLAVQFAPTIFPDRKNFPLQQFFSSPQVAYAVGVFAVLVAPWMEELIFRGVLFAIFEDRVGLRFAVITTAVLFAAMHIPEYKGAWNHLFLLLIVGLVFSFTRGLTGSLAPSVVLHMAYNFTQLVMLYFATDHFRSVQSLGALLGRGLSSAAPYLLWAPW